MSKRKPHEFCPFCKGVYREMPLVDQVPAKATPEEALEAWQLALCRHVVQCAHARGWPTSTLADIQNSLRRVTRGHARASRRPRMSSIPDGPGPVELLSALRCRTR